MNVLAVAARQRARVLVAALIASASAILPSSARAQSAPTTGEDVIRAMHDRYAKTWYHTLTFTQKTTLKPKPDTTVIETWLEKAVVPGRLRIDMQKATGKLAVIFVNDSTYVMNGDSLKRSPGGNYLLTIGFDVYGQPAERTISQLATEHFPMSPMHEDSWQGRPVYVIGAAAGDTHSPQLWIDKERLLYVRSLRPARPDSTKTSETLFENYVQMPGGGWLSEKVEFSTNGQMYQREEYSDVHVNGPVDSKIFVARQGQ
jgi:hypothetical protein